MQDLIWALLFFLWYEALTLPLRVALVGTPARADVRRLISRLAGPAMIVLPLWFLGHLGSLALNQAAGLVWVLALFGLALWWKGRGAPIGQLLAYRDTREDVSEKRRQLAVDGVTLALFLGFVLVRRWIPEMAPYPIDSSGAEKFMNAMVFWANWYATDLPPQDYWLAGHDLRYYYWGHFHWAWIGRMGGFPVELALNLAFARLVTLVFESGYLLARAIGLRPGWSLAAGVAVAWGGNPSAVGGMWQTWQSSLQGFAWQAFDYWKPSRAIADSVIDEFPAFSAILGDFHAHHLALPWLVAWFALTVAGGRWLAGSRRIHNTVSGHRDWGWYGSLLLAVLWVGLGVVAALANLWNLPIIGFGVVLLGLCVCFRRQRPGVASLVPVVALGLLWWLGARLILGGDTQPLPITDGEGLWERLPVKWLPGELRSSVVQIFAMWGLPITVVVFAALRRAVIHLRPMPVLLVVITILVLAAVMTMSALASLPGGAVWVWIALAALIVFVGAGSHPGLSRRTVWMLLAALAVLLGLELLFVDDAYTGEYERYNTYFKFSFAVWPVFIVGAVAAARSLWRAGGHAAFGKGLVGLFRAVVLVVMVAALVYPVCGIPARLLSARQGDAPLREPTLSAVDFIAHRPPYDEEAAMLAWIRKYIPPGETVAEGHGDDAYAYVGRVASLAGRPTLLGWAHHERQWRGVTGHELSAERQAAIDRLYQASTPQELRQQAGALDVKWILYGIIERQRYGDPQTNAAALQVLMEAGRLVAAFPEEQPTVFLFAMR